MTRVVFLYDEPQAHACAARTAAPAGSLVFAKLRLRLYSASGRARFVVGACHARDRAGNTAPAPPPVLAATRADHRHAGQNDRGGAERPHRDRFAGDCPAEKHGDERIHVRVGRGLRRDSRP